MAGQKTITQRIAFSGGEEMVVQLKKIGDAGEFQFKRIKQAAQDATSGDIGKSLTKTFADLQKGFGEVSKSANAFGRSMKDLGDNAESMGRNIRNAALVVVGAAAGFLKLAGDAGKAQESLENSAKAAGLSVPVYTSLRDGFKIAGIEGSDFDNILKRMNRSIDEHNKQASKAAKEEKDLSNQFIRGKITADEYVEKYTDLLEKRREDTEEAKKSGDAFDRLGVKIADFKNDPRAALQAITEAFAQMPEGIEKAALEVEIFGRSGTKIAAVGGQIAELEKEAAKFRVTVGEGAAANLKAFDDSLDHIGITLESLRRAFFGVFTGSLARVINAIGQAIVAQQGTILGFAQTIQDTVMPILNDFARFIENGFRVPEDSTKGFLLIYNAVVNIVEAVKLLGAIFVAVFETISAVLDPVADLLNRLFGTQLNGQILAIAAAVLYFSGVLGTVFSAVKALYLGFNLIWDAVALALSPGGLILLGFAALAAAIVAIIAYWPEIKAGFEDFVNSVTNFFQPVIDLWNGFVKILQKAWELLKLITGQREEAQAAAASGGGEGYASGGFVSGPGSGTSDSIMARLSNGEFVQRAMATSYYGTRFMNALNNLQIPRDAIRGLLGFANGGLVTAVSGAMSDFPRFATGGLVDTAGLGGVKGSHPLTLVIDGEKFTGMSAEDRTFDKLQKFAVRRSIQSAGRKPLWVG